MKPTNLNFRVEDGLLFGLERDTGADYRISWCGNGAYSHYVLNALDKPRTVWYVYVDEKDQLYRAIRHAEMTMIYGAVPCKVCKTNYINPKFDRCSWHKDKCLTNVKDFYPTFYKSLKRDVMRNYGLSTILQALIEITQENNIDNQPYLNTLESDLQAALDNYSNKNKEDV
jgi:hypothetical protein